MFEMVNQRERALLQVEQTTQARLSRYRRELHERPELSGQEAHTADYIAERLDKMAATSVRTRVGGHGVVAEVKGKLPGKAVLVRADMDGLPLNEASNEPFSSKNSGVMHACGHDVHMAIALELADALSVNTDRLPGLVRFAFQPAEERGAGAKPMIDAGVLEGIDRVIGLHVWSELPLGQVSVRPDVVMASADMFRLTISGRSGHGAQPHLTVDAVTIAAQVISALQTLVSRETAPTAPVVLTIGSVHGGSAPNIVAGEVAMQATLRTFDKGLRGDLLRRIDELAKGIARSMRGDCRLQLESEAPPVVNDPGVAALVKESAESVLGAQQVVAFQPLMVGEDFAYFLEARPGCFFLLGAAPNGPPVLHHTPEFRIDEGCLAVGYRVMAAAVLHLLEAG
jgi:amidohydrolase